MHRPVLVTAPEVLPVTLDEVKLSLRIDGTDLDDEIEAAIRSAVSHYEGWSGILGICLVEQTWRQDFDAFCQDFPLPLRPVQSVASVKYRNEAGEISTIADSNYTLRTDSGGRAFARFANDYSAPSSLYETAAINIEYVAGWPVVDDIATTPEDIKSAIKLRAQLQIDESAREGSAYLERAEEALISKYRQPSM